MAFQLVGVSNDDERYANLLVSLKGDALRAVGDLVNNPPGVNKFLALKERLINHFAPTPESHLRRMLRGEDMTGKKPSAILAHVCKAYFLMDGATHQLCGHCSTTGFQQTGAL